MNIDSSSLSAVGQVSAIGGAPSAALVAGAAAKAIAIAVLGKLGSQILEAATQWPAGSSEPYPVSAWAEALGSQLGASPMETLELEAGLGALAGSIAADMASLADGRTLDRLDAALADAGATQLPADASNVARHFEDLASHIAQAR